MADDSHKQRKTVLVAGSTGHIGSHVVQKLLQSGYNVKALVRPRYREASGKLHSLFGQLPVHEEGTLSVVYGEATQSDTIQGHANGCEILVSALGVRSVTDVRDGTVFSVDRDATINVFREAKRAGVKHVVVVGTLEGPGSRTTVDLSRAKEEAIEAVTQEAMLAGITYTVIRPTAYFTDFVDFPWKHIAHASSWGLPNHGTMKINPISGEDVAEFIVDSLDNPDCYNQQVPLGGPDVLTLAQVGEMIAKALGKEHEYKPYNIPTWKMKLMLTAFKVAGLVYPPAGRTAGQLEWMLYLTAHDSVAPPHGVHHLESYLLIKAAKEGRPVTEE